MIQLADIIGEHPTEVEYELIRHGTRLRDLPSRGLSWRDLWVILLHAPPDSPFARALSTCGHTAPEHMQMAALHVALVANWQRAHGKKSTAPKLADCLAGEDTVEKTKYGTAAMDLDEARDWLGWGDRVPAMN